jgi:hypothetical protein
MHGTNVKITVQVVPVPAMKAYGGREGTFSVLNLGSRWRRMVTFMADHFTINAC